MSAAAAVSLACAAGIQFGLDGDDLVLTALAPPAPAVLDLLSRNKPAIVVLLRRADRGWSTEQWRRFFDQRAAIAMDGSGLSRDLAEARAFACCITEWLNRDVQRSAADRCCACGGPERGDDPLQPRGIESSGHVWLHRRCWPAWYAGRKAEAAAALAIMGITQPSNFPNDFGKNGGV